MSTPRKRKPKGSGKGQQWERDVCRLLSSWVSVGERMDLFWRSASSGGRATEALKKGEFLSAQAGDIVAVAAGGMPLTERFLVECKFWKSLEWAKTVHQLKSAKLLQFWLKCVAESETHGRRPMLIAKENRRDPVVVLHAGTAKRLGIDDARWQLCTVPPVRAHVYRLSSFLGFCPWEIVERKLRSGSQPRRITR